MATSDMQETDIENASIFVSVINYRDCDGQFTLNDLFKKASNPSRIFVGYCLQYDAMRDVSQDINFHYAKLYESSIGSNIRSLFIPHSDARGPVYARYLVQNKLQKNEKYCLQIDAHCRFVSDWDTLLIRMYHECNDSKAVITTYPNPFVHKMAAFKLSSPKNRHCNNGFCGHSLSITEEPKLKPAAINLDSFGFFKIFANFFDFIRSKPSLPNLSAHKIEE